MALVDYGSSDSESEQPKLAPPSRNKATKPGKAAFEKLVDRANPGVVRVNLAEEPRKFEKEDAKDSPEPPAKRVKTGTFGGFNSFLPAPKRSAAVPGGLGKGVSLKTGLTPGFTREPMTETSTYDHDPQKSNELENAKDTENTAMALDKESSGLLVGAMDTAVDVKSTKKSTVFKPLSVARKPPKKKAALPASQNTTASTDKAEAKHEKAEQKVSLFSVGDMSDTTVAPTTSTSAYKPLVYHPTTSNEPIPNPYHSSEPEESLDPSSASSPPPDSSTHPESLDSIATDLNLSASARRQLLGRHHQRGDHKTSIKITNFSTDREYAANEALRQSGEIVQHHAVRGVAPGKHSLKQLVNAATTQKEALEEQFAAGKRNKSEAGARYGW